MYFTYTIPGCISEINTKVSENEVRGKTTDLSPFGCDLTQWQDLEIRVVNKNVTVYLANKKIFEKPYEQSLGLIAGIGFTSNGICEVDKVSLEDLKGRVIYGSGFCKSVPQLYSSEKGCGTLTWVLFSFSNL